MPLKNNRLPVITVIALASAFWALMALSQRRAHIMPTACVLEPGISIVFQNPNGSGTITYLGPCRRHFKLSNGLSRAVELTPRKDTFDGKRGLYDPAEKWFYELWKPQGRLVVEESQRSFESAEQIRAALHEGRDVDRWVWNDRGYVVGFFTDLARNQTNVTIYRLLIGNAPFEQLPECEGGFVDVVDTRDKTEERKKGKG